MKKLLKVSLVGMRYHSPPFDTYSAIFHYPISLEREPNNPHDPNAVAVVLKGYVVGYLDRDSARTLSLILAKKLQYTVTTVTTVNQQPISPNARTIHLKVELESELPIPPPPKPARGRQAGIYRISVCGDKWIYIGQSVDINNRIAKHWNDLSFSSHANCNLQEKWDKLGHSSFAVQVVEYAPKGTTELERQRWLGEKEQFWIEASKKTSTCINIMDGEVVATKRAQAEFDAERKQSIKQHDAAVREKKKKIKALIKEWRTKGIVPQQQYQTAIQIVQELDEAIRKNSGLRGFFFGTASESVIKQKQIELNKARQEVEKAKSAMSEINSKIVELAKEYRRLMTIKQQNNVTTRILARSGIYLTINRKKIY